MPKSTCSVPGCGTPARTRGWCGPHYQRWRRYGDPLASAPPRAEKICTVDGCGEPHVARGYCNRHYQSEWVKPNAEPCIVDRCGSPAIARGLCPRHYTRELKHGDVAFTEVRPPGLSLTEAIAYHTPQGLLDDDCWDWLGGFFSAGYGYFRWEGKSRLAHRYAYIAKHGPIPEGLLVRHSCDRHPCVNPNHLLLGTPADNMQDCVDRGRRPQGEKHAASKVSEDDIREIRRLATSGVSYAELGRRYSMTGRNISSIVTRKTWKHVS